MIFLKINEKGVESMNKVDDFLTMTKLNDLLKKKDDDEKKATKIIWIITMWEVSGLRQDRS